MEAPRSLTGEVTSAWKEEEGSLESSALRGGSTFQMDNSTCRGPEASLGMRTGEGAGCAMASVQSPSRSKKKEAQRSQRICITATSRFRCPGGGKWCSAFAFPGRPQGPRKAAPWPS